MATAENVKAKPETWDEIVQSAHDIPDILPTLKMTDNKEIKIQSLIVEFLEDMPKRIDFKNKKTQKDDHFFGIPIKRVDTGEQLTLPVSAKSLQNALGKLFEEKGSLRGIRAKIFLDFYQHREYGKTLRYNVTEVTTG